MSLPIRVLVAEDDGAKARAVTDDLLLTFGGADVVCSVAGSVSQALALIKKGTVDLLVADLSLPLQGGATPVAKGGLRLLEDLDARRDVTPPAHVVGLTAYADIAAEQREHFQERGWILVQYDPMSDSWASPLRRKVAHIIALRGPTGGSGFRTDVCIVTALDAPELDAVLELPGPWRRDVREGDSTVYHHTVWTTSGREISVVAASGNAPGMAIAAAMTMKMIYMFRPRVLAMCGIAAGIGVGMGDILVADQLWDYGSGKVFESLDGGEQFAAAPGPLPMDQGMKARIACFVREKGPRALGEVEARWAGERPGTPLRVHVGPIASGAAVVASRLYIERIKEQQRKVIGVEMEGYAVGMAARFADEPRPVALVIKSVSDLGDKHKADAWQRYAAHTSARFLHQLMCDELIVEALR